MVTNLRSFAETTAYNVRPKSVNSIDLWNERLQNPAPRLRRVGLG
jgi:hypothetical protein